MKKLLITIAVAVAPLFVISTARDVAALEAVEVVDPAACGPELKQAKKCMRWYNLAEKASPDACQAARLSGEKCGRWYSVISAPPPKEEIIVLRGIKFDTAKADIKLESIPILERNIAALKRKSNTQIVIEGHTDARGSDAYNQSLSEARAQSVLNWFSSHGVDRGRMTAVGKGESRPVADNTSPEGMAENRRIEVHMR
jgi:outer membrane protein OmpA-like peptidoglycan-associated protein